MSAMDDLKIKLKEGKEEVKDYHFMVKWFATISEEYYEFDVEEDVESEEMWEIISEKMIHFGYPKNKFSAEKCRDKFYKWSSFYAKNFYDLNNKLEPRLQRIFNSLKIVHILPFNRIWGQSNTTRILLQQISRTKEIRDYLKSYDKRKNELMAEREETDSSFDDLNGDELISSFENMNLKEELLRGIRDLGIETPSIVQQKGIPRCLKGQNMVAQAQSGTGKTLVFAIAVLQRIDTSINECQALILCPTHELSQQITEEISKIGRYMNVKCHTSIGGTDRKYEVNTLEEQFFHILVGTPGRVLDIFEEMALNTDFIKMFVLDEADKLMDLNGKFVNSEDINFQNPIYKIYRELMPRVQVILTSATLPKQFFKRIKAFMRHWNQILIKNNELTLEGLQQYYVNTMNEDIKYQVLLDLIDQFQKIKSFESSKVQMIVFCNYRANVNYLSEKYKEDDISFIHGKMDQVKREKILNEFRHGERRILITSDLLGRGIDVKGDEVVINYDFPNIREMYIHRVGRSGRFGRTGKAISFLTQSGEDQEMFKTVQDYFHTQILKLPHNLNELF